MFPSGGSARWRLPAPARSHVLNVELQHHTPSNRSGFRFSRIKRRLDSAEPVTTSGLSTFPAAAYLRVDASLTRNHLKCTLASSGVAARTGRAGASVKPHHVDPTRGRVCRGGVLCACSGRGCRSSGGPSASPSAARRERADEFAGLARGGAGRGPLDAAQRGEVAATAAKVPPAERARLRYALATGDDGRRTSRVRRRGLDAGGRGPRNATGSRLPVLNAADSEHYDPQQTASSRRFRRRPNATTPSEMSER